METNKHIQWVKNELVKPKYTIGDIVETKYGRGIIIETPRLDSNGLGIIQRGNSYGVYFGMGEDKTNLEFINKLSNELEEDYDIDKDNILSLAKSHTNLLLQVDDILSKYD